MKNYPVGKGLWNRQGYKHTNIMSLRLTESWWIIQTKTPTSFPDYQVSVENAAFATWNNNTSVFREKPVSKLPSY